MPDPTDLLTGAGFALLGQEVQLPPKLPTPAEPTICERWKCLLPAIFEAMNKSICHAGETFKAGPVEHNYDRALAQLSALVRTIKTICDEDDDTFDFFDCDPEDCNEHYNPCCDWREFMYDGDVYYGGHHL